MTIAVTAESVGLDHPAGLRPGDYVRLCVSDTGKGMDDATLNRAIEPFFSTKGLGQGTGSWAIDGAWAGVQLGGALTIESQPGQGAHIAIWLPRSVERPALDVSPVGAGGRGADAGVVLLVDDEAHIRAITAEMLTELGFQVHEANAPEAALLAVQAGFKPDLLVTDHLMPGMTGVELAHAIQAVAPDTRALIISGFAEVESLDASLHRLAKPFVQSDLATALAEIRA